MPKTAAQRGGVIDRRTPAQIAIEKLAKLTAQGMAAPRLASATVDILAGWRSQDVALADMKEQVEALHSSIEAGVQAAQDYVAEAESETAKVAAARQLEALSAMAKLLVGELSRV